MRTPMIQNAVKAAVGESKIALNVNADEAAVLGTYTSHHIRIYLTVLQAPLFREPASVVSSRLRISVSPT